MALTPNQLLWVEALESGKYKQCFGKLRDDKTGAMCALGLLNEIAHQNGVSDALCSEIQASESTAKWVGLTDRAAVFGPDEDQDSILCLNDVLNMPFKEIAAIIRSEPEGLFVKEAQ